jgi:N-methylhydantoinase B
MITDPIRLEIFKHLFAAIPEEMGVVLRKSSYSPNIKERRDFSCALFNASGEMIAQAAHIPVHLGAMPLSVQAAVDAFADDLHPGDMIILNDPYRGGTHLPDITLVAPIFIETGAASFTLFGFAANRAHHADVGGMAAGSMPIARELYQEGLIIPPLKLIAGGKIVRAAWDLLLANVRTPQERAGDLRAQIAANQRGVARLQAMLTRYGPDEVAMYMTALLDYTERMTRALLLDLPDGTYAFTDYLDDDGLGSTDIPITVTISIEGDAATVDFTGSAPQQKGSVNAVYAITLSAVSYVFRCLLGLDVPNNSGGLRPVRVIAPEGTVVNARKPAPVAGGNVETSQRITDVVLGAMAQAVPDRIPAASQGTMNNITIGGHDPRTDRPFTYYETICGGTGGTPEGSGVSALHSHMTNTLNTPVEAMEYAYPFLVQCCEIRTGSGGAGHHPGGDGLVRDIQLLTDAEANLLTERRTRGAYGLNGGGEGLPGENILRRDGVESPLPAKGRVELRAGDVISIHTPGGGGWGSV